MVPLSDARSARARTRAGVHDLPASEAPRPSHAQMRRTPLAAAGELAAFHPGEGGRAANSCAVYWHPYKVSASGPLPHCGKVMQIPTGQGFSPLGQGRPRRRRCGKRQVKSAAHTGSLLPRTVPQENAVKFRNIRDLGWATGTASAVPGATQMLIARELDAQRQKCDAADAEHQNRERTEIAVKAETHDVSPRCSWSWS